MVPDNVSFGEAAMGGQVERQDGGGLFEGAERPARLADPQPGGARQREQSSACEQSPDLLNLLAASDKAGELGWQVVLSVLADDEPRAIVGLM